MFNDWNSVFPMTLAVARRLRFSRPGLACFIRNGVAALIFVLLAPRLMWCQQEDLATLHGTVRDSQGNPVSNVLVCLQAKEPAQVLSTHTDSQGNYSFSRLHDGVYTLQAEMKDYVSVTIPSLFLRPKEAKKADLALMPAAPRSSQSTTSPPAFFDQPQFTVSGVTDTTSLGGHGSDTIVRTRETIAKATAALGKTPANSPPAAADVLEKSLRENLERNPRDFETIHRLGKFLFENGKSREAIPYLEHAAEIRPADYENAYDLALTESAAGDFEHARDHAQAMLPHNDKAELHHLLGDVQEKLGDSLAAVHEYQRAAELDPNETYFFDWGSELLLHHAPEPALEVFTKGNYLYPHSTRMLIGLGAAWFARGSYDQAVERICEASDLDPNDSVPYLFLGKMQAAENTPSRPLVEKLHRFVDLQPKNTQANYYYAVGLWKLGAGTSDEANLAQVEALLNHAVEIDPKFGAPYLQLGIVYSQQANYPKAIASYQQAIHVDPRMEEAHYRLAQVYRHIGETRKARAELQAYDQVVKESTKQTERERHEIRQFVYSLRDQAPAQPH